MASDLDINDKRVEFVADYVLKTMKLKGDKWTKMYSLEENKQMFLEFFDKSDHSNLIVTVSSAGALSVGYEWPATLRNQKACYFVKKSKENIQKDSPLRNSLIYGDLSYSPMDQLSAFVDEVFNFKL